MLSKLRQQGKQFFMPFTTNWWKLNFSKITPANGNVKSKRGSKREIKRENKYTLRDHKSRVKYGLFI